MSRALLNFAVAIHGDQMLTSVSARSGVVVRSSVSGGR